jgi:hypothetical protein
VSIEKRLTKVQSEYGSYPRLVITVEGIDDVYRIARALEGQQVEFGRLANLTLRGLDRRWPGTVRALVARMGPTRPWQYPGVRPKSSAVPEAPE